tara:strand:- start:188 stop:322 length:135 start_codon:yes stop_codon:yes gene_type:complete
VNIEELKIKLKKLFKKRDKLMSNGQNNEDLNDKIRGVQKYIMNM